VAKTASPPKPKPSTYYAETATAIASQIKGCTDVAAGDIGQGGPGMASTATCILNGRTITINSWSTAEARDGVDAVLQANKTEAYFAKGQGWTVTATDDPTLQHQMTNDAGALMANASEGQTTASSDLPGEKSSAEAVVASLGGAVVQIHP